MHLKKDYTFTITAPIAGVCRLTINVDGAYVTTEISEDEACRIVDASSEAIERIMQEDRPQGVRAL